MLGAMCGICGLFGSIDPRAGAETVRRMSDCMRHRGPDDEGFHTDPPAFLGFRRLSIIDLHTGHQPLANEDDSVWIAFNGEIYNHLELRAELEKKGHHYRTRTDTETIVHLYEEEGPHFARRLNGMFGIALWDTKRRRLVLVREPPRDVAVRIVDHHRESRVREIVGHRPAHPAQTDEPHR